MATRIGGVNLSKKIIAYGGSAGGLLVSNVVNQEPDIFLGAIMAVPFVDNLTTEIVNYMKKYTLKDFVKLISEKNNLPKKQVYNLF